MNEAWNNRKTTASGLSFLVVDCMLLFVLAKHAAIIFAIQVFGANLAEKIDFKELFDLVNFRI